MPQAGYEAEMNAVVRLARCGQVSEMILTDTPTRHKMYMTKGQAALAYTSLRLYLGWPDMAK